MRLATKNDINSLSLIRVKEQKEDWNEEFEDKYDLVNITKLYLKII